MYGWKLLAVAALGVAVVVGSAAPTVAQPPAPMTPAAAAPVAGAMPMAVNPCNPCVPCTPCCYGMTSGGVAMGYPYGPQMMSSAYYTPQARRGLFNRRAATTYVAGPTYPVAPVMGTMPAMGALAPAQVTFVPAPMPSTAVTGTAAATAAQPVEATRPATAETGTTGVATAPAAQQPVATLPPGYFMTVNGQLVPMAGSSFYPMEPVSNEAPRRLRLFRR